MTLLAILPFFGMGSSYEQAPPLPMAVKPAMPQADASHRIVILDGDSHGTSPGV